jgi:U1 small nuclear ribonucleoprotein
VYGPIKRIRIVVNSDTGKPRGYAFIEYESERDFQSTFFLKCNPLVALERGNGRKVDGERVIVDYERGRTNKDWLPRKLGGGKGDSRRDREQERIIRDLKKNTEELRSKSRSVDKKIKSEKVESSVKEEKKEPASTNGKDSTVKRERSRSRNHSRGRDDKRGDKKKKDKHDTKKRDRKEREKSEPKISEKQEPASTGKVLAQAEVKKEEKIDEAEPGEITV